MINKVYIVFFNVIALMNDEDKNCSIFNNFGNLLIIISLSINIFFYLKFDKKFNLAFY